MNFWNRLFWLLLCFEIKSKTKYPNKSHPHTITFQMFLWENKKTFFNLKSSDHNMFSKQTGQTNKRNKLEKTIILENTIQFSETFLFLRTQRNFQIFFSKKINKIIFIFNSTKTWRKSDWKLKFSSTTTTTELVKFFFIYRKSIWKKCLKISFNLHPIIDEYPPPLSTTTENSISLKTKIETFHSTFHLTCVYRLKIRLVCDIWNHHVLRPKFNNDDDQIKSQKSKVHFIGKSVYYLSESQSLSPLVILAVWKRVNSATKATTTRY